MHSSVLGLFDKPKVVAASSSYKPNDNFYEDNSFDLGSILHSGDKLEYPKLAPPAIPDNIGEFGLAELFNFFGSDKDRNGYSQIYHTLFHHLKDNPVNLLEIGIGTMIPDVSSSMVGYALDNYAPGGSLRAWSFYFPKGQIVGVDVQPDTQFTDAERVETYLCDSMDTQKVNELGEKLDRKFDVIVDDGSHLDQHQLMTLKNFFPLVKEGGIYIIEDIYPGSMITDRPEILSQLLPKDTPYFFVGVKNNICVVYKQSLKSNRKGY